MAEKNEKPPRRDRLDLAIKFFTPIAAGLLIAWAGFISQWALSKISSRQESARLITELQVNREQAESDLRKDIFVKTLEELLSDEPDSSGLPSLSQRLVRLELLALNFGDSLSLSPLFTDFRRDLLLAEPAVDMDPLDHKLLIGALEKRLQGLAKRVADNQLSSVVQHGIPVPIRIPLPQDTANTTCEQLAFDPKEYKWPNDAVKLDLISLVGTEGYEAALADEIAARSTMELGSVKRKITLTISKADHCTKTVVVNLDIERFKDKPETFQGSSGSYDEDLIPEVEREFRLDYYNFPKIDNTRLSNNQRFAVVMGIFETENDPRIELTGVIFPAEYASLRDRTGMREAKQLLQKALSPDDTDNESSNIGR
jgi:hypothetical protein